MIFVSVFENNKDPKLFGHSLWLQNLQQVHNFLPLSSAGCTGLESGCHRLSFCMKCNPWRPWKNMFFIKRCGSYVRPLLLRRPLNYLHGLLRLARLDNSQSNPRITTSPSFSSHFDFFVLHILSSRCFDTIWNESRSFVVGLRRESEINQWGFHTSSSGWRAKYTCVKRRSSSQI